MLHVVTGANGAGKTLNTLKWVRERQKKENRPVCHNGRFDPVPGGELSDWKKIDFKDWQSEPDGTIFLIDEAHNDLPVRPAGQKPEPHISMLAEHRKRGFDFYLITQHPSNLDNFVRRLVGPPGWHRHLKRVFGANLVSMAEYNSVNIQCEKPGQSKDGERKTVRFPKEVFSWYRSATLDTTKKHIPKQIVFVLAAFFLVPLLLYFGIRGVGDSVKGQVPERVAQKVMAGEGGSMPRRDAERIGPKSPADYVADYRPRISGLPHTAPRYDEATKPTRVPVPAACITMKSKGCRCYTQQGTLLGDVPADLCEAVVKGGYFIDFEPNMGGAVAGSAGGSFALSPGAAMPRSAQSSDPAPVVMEIPSQSVDRHRTQADLIAEHRKASYPYLR